MEISPVGWVRSPRVEPIDDDWGNVVATITLDPSFGPDALSGLDRFSHVEVLYHFDRVSPDDVVRGLRRPRHNPSWPESGIFAQRAKNRPNRIGSSVCRLISVDGTTLVVQGLDAIDGTPVIDLKPYMGEFGPRGEIRQPAWSHELMAHYWAAPPASREDREPELLATRRSYDAVAGSYAEQVSQELAAKPLDRALLAALCEMSGNGPVVDVGAGPGHVARFVAGLGAPVLAIDLSPAMCAVAVNDGGVSAVAADMGALPLASSSVGGIACLYAVIHLDRRGRARAYAEFRRVLRPGGCALVAFHTSDADVDGGGSKSLVEWWGQPVDLTFRFLDGAEESFALARAGLPTVARLDRVPVAGAEHASERTYLLVRKGETVRP